VACALRNEVAPCENGDAVVTGRHGWGRAPHGPLVDAVRRLAHDPTLPPVEALGRIRDAFAAYDGA
jgi:hypothetical protein